MGTKIRLIQTWELGKQIGTGGFGKVYLAQSEAKLPAVVKLIPKTPGAERELLFEKLDNIPNIIPIIDSGEWNEYWVIVMKRATKSLRTHLDEVGRPLKISEALPILIDIATALAAIDGHVVHRDIKPENILLLDGRWHLADFGIARYAAATTAPDTRKYAMSPPYAAPEQWYGDQATNAADVYSFGIVAYELLHGSQPFKGPNFRQQHLEHSPEPLHGISDWLKSLISECLFKSSPTRPVAQELLERMKLNPQPVTPAALRLQQANTLAIDARAEEARIQSAEKVAIERFGGLHIAAKQSLETILALLQQQIKKNAPSAQIVDESVWMKWALNDAILWVDHWEFNQPSTNQVIPFEVAAHTAINLVLSVKRKLVSGGYSLEPDVGRSHSLWFCNAQNPSVFRWYEVAFWSKRQFAHWGIQPFALPPDKEDAKFALSRALHTCQVARPFTAIDQGNTEIFVEQWIDRFAKAAQGELYKPHIMPEGNPYGSWRQE